MILILLLGMIFYFFCDLKTVKVKNSTLYTEQEIENYVLDDPYSGNTMYVFVKNLIDPREDIPFVDHLDVRLTGLHSVEVTVTEKKMMAYLAAEEGSYIYFDSEGKVMEISDRLIDGLIPVSGIACGEVKAGDKLPVEDDLLTYLTAVLKSLAKYEITPESITFHDLNTVSFLYQGIEVSLGRQEYLDEKMMRIPKILPYLEGMTGILHLENWSPDNTDIVFKKIVRE